MYEKPTFDRRFVRNAVAIMEPEAIAKWVESLREAYKSGLHEAAETVQFIQEALEDQYERLCHQADSLLDEYDHVEAVELAF